MFFFQLVFGKPQFPIIASCLVQISQNGLERGLESETLPIGRAPLVRQGPGPTMCD